jgi:pseudouridine synthase
VAAIRLQRYLSQCGVAARRKAEEIIRAGRVTVNGRVVTELGVKVDPDTDHVAVDRAAVSAKDFLYVLLNKPKGCVAAASDPDGRPTVMDYLPRLQAPVKPVGWLDFYGEGVLLLTSDGDLAARLQSPRHAVETTYHVKIRGHVKPAHLRALRAGVTLADGTITRPAQVDPLRGESKHDWLVVTLVDGKSGQIHRMLEALGYAVSKLQRVAFAGLSYHGLRVGDARELSQLEVNDLRRAVGLPPTTTSRGTWSARREETDERRRTRGQRARAPRPAGAGPSTTSRRPSSGRSRSSG